MNHVGDECDSTKSGTHIVQSRPLHIPAHIYRELSVRWPSGQGSDRNPGPGSRLAWSYRLPEPWKLRPQSLRDPQAFHWAFLRSPCVRHNRKCTSVWHPVSQTNLMRRLTESKSNLCRSWRVVAGRLAYVTWGGMRLFGTERGRVYWGQNFLETLPYRFRNPAKTSKEAAEAQMARFSNDDHDDSTTK